MSDNERDSASAGRREFFLVGCAAVGLASAGFVVNTFRYLVPTVLYEPPARFTIGDPGRFPPGSVTFLEDRRLFLFNGPEALMTQQYGVEGLSYSKNADGSINANVLYTLRVDATGYLTFPSPPREALPVGLDDDGQCQQVLHRILPMPSGFTGGLTNGPNSLILGECNA